MILPLMNPLPLFQHAFMQASQTRMCYAHVLPPRRSASRTSSQIGACHNARFDNTTKRGESFMYVASLALEVVHYVRTQANCSVPASRNSTCIAVASSETTALWHLQVMSC